MNPKLTIQEKFEGFYKEKKPLKQPKPGLLFRKFLRFFRKDGVTLDLGSGEGRYSLYLGTKGFVVLAIDFSKQAIELLKQSASNLKLSQVIQTKVGDVRSFPKKKYANIVSSYTLHFIPETDWLTVIENMQRQTLPGGVHLIEDFAENPRGKKIPALSSTYPSKKQLLSLYQNWEILSYQTFKVKTRIKTKTGKVRMATAFFFLAKKPE